MPTSSEVSTAGAGIPVPATLLRLRQGYNIVPWQKGEMDYWAIADITVEELEQFRD